jgi:GAF domain-containing protein
LLYAQSHILDNANSVFGSMKRIEDGIRANHELDKTVDTVMDSIARVVPYHRAGIFIKLSRWASLSKSHNLLYPLNDSLANLSIFRSVMETGQPIHVDDVKVSPHWRGMDSFGNFRSWLGVPIQSIFGLEGVLSLGRLSQSPFGNEEIQLAKSFSDYIGIALNKSPDPQETYSYLERVKLKAQL